MDSDILTLEEAQEELREAQRLLRRSIFESKQLFDDPGLNLQKRQELERTLFESMEQLKQGEEQLKKGNAVLEQARHTQETDSNRLVVVVLICIFVMVMLLVLRQ